MFPIGSGDDLESEVRSVGIYVNPGNTGFLESIRSEIYVDKTELIGCTNRFLGTEDKQAQALWQVDGPQDAGRLLQPGL